MVSPCVAAVQPFSLAPLIAVLNLARICDDMVEPLAFCAVFQNTTALFEQAFHILRRLRIAYERQKNLVEVLARHESELNSVETIIRFIEAEKELQNDAVAAELVRVSDVQTKLKDLLLSLDPLKTKGRMNQIARQFVQGSADERKLSTIMDELVHVKAMLLLRIQVAQVGVMENMRKELVAEAEVIQRIDKYLREHVSNCKGLRIARLLEDGRPLENGTVPITAEELQSLSRQQSEESSEDEALVDELEIFSRDLPIRTERIVLHNKSRGRALQINAPVDRDITKDLNRLVIKHNLAEEESLQVNHGVPLQVLAFLTTRQDKLMAISRNGQHESIHRL